MTRGSDIGRTTVYEVLGLLLLPFLLFFWMVPGLGTAIIGNDYVVHAPMEQLETQFALSRGEFPLFIPGYATGVSVATLTMSQVWHPVSHLTARLPGFATGQAFVPIVLVDLLELGLTHLLLYLTLGRLSLERTLSFCLSFMTVYNLRMLDCLRFGASLDAYLGMLWLSCALVWAYLYPNKRRTWMAVALATYLTVVSGHPQMAYYALVGAAFIWMAVPHLVPTLQSDGSHRLSTWSFYGRSVLAVLLGTVLSACYILPLAIEFLLGGTSRTGMSHHASLMFTDTLQGTLNNFVWPFQSDVHSAFGGSLLLLVGLLAPWLGRRRPPPVVLILWMVVLATLVFALGEATFFHEMVWKTVPFQKAMRTPGRATMIVPLLLMWLLVWALGHKETEPCRITPAAWGLVLVVLALLPWSTAETGMPYTPSRLHTIPLGVRAIWLACGLGSLVSLALLVRGSGSRYALRILLALCVALQGGLVLRYGSWTTQRPSTPSFAQLAALKQQQLRSYPAFFGAGMYPPVVRDHLERTFVQPELARLFPRFEAVQGRAEVYERFRERGRARDLALIEADLESRSSDSQSFQGQLRLESASYNRLEFQVSNNQASVFSLAFPYRGRWRAVLDGSNVPTFRCNAQETGVLLPAGEHRLVFQFQSLATRLGVTLSLVGLFLLTTYGVGGLSSRPGRWAACGVAAAAGVLAYGLWNVSLGSGPSLDSRDEWTHRPFPRTDHAYGQMTSARELLLDRVHQTHSTRAVDGDRRTFFLTPWKDQAWWQVSLGQSRQVGRIEIELAPGLPPPDSLRLEFLNDQGAVQGFAPVPIDSTGPPFVVGFDLVPSVAVSALKLSPHGTNRSGYFGLAEVRLLAPRLPGEDSVL